MAIMLSPCACALEKALQYNSNVYCSAPPLCMDTEELDRLTKPFSGLAVPRKYWGLGSPESSCFRNFSGTPTPGTFSKVLPRQMGGVPQYRSCTAVQTGSVLQRSRSSRLRSQESTTIQIEGLTYVRGFPGQLLRVHILSTR